MTFKHLQKSGKKAEHARLNSYGFHEGGLGTLWAHTEPQAGDQVLLKQIGSKHMLQDKHFGTIAQEHTIEWT